jgi:hypothetical protein
MSKEVVSRTGFAFLVGATVGAGVMLLLAPQAGSELRASVRDYTRKAKDHWDQASERGASVLDLLFQRGKEWIQRARPNRAIVEVHEIPSTDAGRSAARSGDHSTGDTGQDN